jgi:glycosylphosphatidylinositol transamidase (GPIT) subunit GPI8
MKEVYSWFHTLALAVCFFSTFLTAQEFSNKAMIWNAGKYFYNYRMEVSSFYIRNALFDMGLDSKDIIQVKADNFICNANAQGCPSLRYVPQDSDSILRGPYEADYSMRDNNPVKYLELLVGRYEPQESNNRKIERDENTNFFFYTIGHGGDLYFKIQDTEVVFAQQVSDYLSDPAQRIKYRESFLLSDSCSAGTLFSECKHVKNTYMLGTSAWKQAATSYDHDSVYTQPLNDKFLFHFKKLLLPQLIKDDKVSIHKLKATINNKLLLSDLLTFNNLPRNDMLIYLNDYMRQHETRKIETIKVHSERVNSLIDGFFKSINQK